MLIKQKLSKMHFYRASRWIMTVKCESRSLIPHLFLLPLFFFSPQSTIHVHIANKILDYSEMNRALLSIVASFRLLLTDVNACRGLPLNPQIIRSQYNTPRPPNVEFIMRLYHHDGSKLQIIEFTKIKKYIKKVNGF